MPRPPLSQNRTMAILNKAQKEGYAVIGMCCYNIEAIMATVRAAEALNAPAMVLLFPWAMEYAGDSLVRAAADACHNAKVPVSLHLDHCQTPELVRRAADIEDGFDSIMCDMSHYEKDENLQLTRELNEYCHARGIATEAEPGRIDGGEDGVASLEDLEAVLTTPDVAEEFVATGIELLAPAFGNVHGEYGPRGVQLDFERLEKINAKVGDRVRISLHGVDKFTQEIFDKCIKGGVCKANLNRDVNDEYAKVLEGLSGAPITKRMEAGTLAMQKALENYIRVLHSEGKA